MALDWKGTVKYAAGHPGIFAGGVGLANGLLARARNKKIDPKTAITLASVLGIGELVLIAYEPPSERGAYSLTEVGVWSVFGVLAGLVPFISWNVEPGELAHPALVASVDAPTTTAVSGYSRRRTKRKYRRAA